MKSRLVAAVLAAGLLCISAQANAFELFGLLGGGYGGCGCDNVCGCDAAPKCGCDNGCHNRCHRDRCCRDRCHRHRGCGCDVSCAAPTCAAPMPTCEAMPSCGYEKASCGCDRGCHRDRCGKQRCHRGCWGGWFNRGCGCHNACGCDAAPACGCDAAPKCGY
jgi:hypothetical protein